PSQRIDDVRDVRLERGVVAAVEAGLRPAPGEQVLDATGLLVTPGLIDLHVHVFPGASHYGIEPDPHCLATGTTTVVDAGSAGALTLRAFQKYVIQGAETRVPPFPHTSATRLLSPDVGELEDIRFVDKSKALQTIEAHRGLIRGVKVRLSRELVGNNARAALGIARETGEAARLPIMVHPGDTPIGLAEILGALR